MRDTAALRQKVEEISYKAPEGMQRVPWIETLVLTNEIDTTELKSAEDTVKLEKAMHDAAMLSVKEGYRRLAAMNVPATRPADFMAEMLRDDSTMLKVKGKLAEEASKIKAVETRKRVQAEKKFAKKGVSLKPTKPSRPTKQSEPEEYTPLANTKMSGKKPFEHHKGGKPKQRFNKQQRPQQQQQENKYQGGRGGKDSKKKGGNFKKPRKDLFKGKSKGKSQNRRR